ncbi:MAG TPA: hypothetical protein VEC59_10700, partial [Steroidobacteraceae bacterium]|nr:hypothetical protein [Steroidobacteraceae bacterium]
LKTHWISAGHVAPPWITTIRPSSPGQPTLVGAAQRRWRSSLVVPLPQCIGSDVALQRRCRAQHELLTSSLRFMGGALSETL